MLVAQTSGSRCLYKLLATVKILLPQLGRSRSFHLEDLVRVILVVDTVSKDVAKVSQCSLYAICDCLLLALVQTLSLVLDVDYLAITNVFVGHTVSQTYFDNGRHSDVVSLGFLIIVNIVDGEIGDA